MRRVIQPLRQFERLVEKYARVRAASRQRRDAPGHHQRLLCQRVIFQRARVPQSFFQRVLLIFAFAQGVGCPRQQQCRFDARDIGRVRQQRQRAQERGLRVAKRELRQILRARVAIRSRRFRATFRAFELKRARAPILWLAFGERIRRAGMERDAPRGREPVVDCRSHEVVREFISRRGRLQKSARGQFLGGGGKRQR